MAQDPERLVDVSQPQIPGLEGLWRDALFVTEEMAGRLLAAVARDQADELIPTEILINPHQLALKLDEREADSTENDSAA